MILEKNENYIPKLKKNYIFVQKIIYYFIQTTIYKDGHKLILIYQYTHYHL